MEYEFQWSLAKYFRLCFPPAVLVFIYTFWLS